MNRLTLSLALACLSGSALGATATDLRNTIQDDCIRKEIFRGNTPDGLRTRCDCLTSAIERTFTLADLIELQRYTREQRDPGRLPQWTQMQGLIGSCQLI